MSAFPSGPSRDVDRDYIRYRLAGRVAGPPAAAATFTAQRSTISSMTRYEASGTGQMIDATEMAWFRIDNYNGFVDIVMGDVLVELQSWYNLTVVATEEEGPYLKVTLKATQRAGGGTR